jgi:hypothetical protein
MAEKWIPKKLKSGRVSGYLKRKYGKVAFNSDGTIKVSYIRKAIADLKAKGGNSSLIRALRLAITFKRMKK